MVWLGNGSARRPGEAEFGSKQLGQPLLAARRRAEQVLERPAGGQVKADAAGGLAHASADFEELGAQGFDLRRTPGLG